MEYEVMNLDKYVNIETRWVALYVKRATALFFDSFSIDQITRFS